MLKKTVVFDLDGTLIDSVGDIHAALNEMLARAGSEPLALEAVTSFVGRGSADLVKKVINTVGLPDDETSHNYYLTDFLRIYTAKPATLTTVFCNAYKVLKNFQAHGVEMGICTNKPQIPAKIVLDQFGMMTFFTSIVGGDRLPTRKPDPAMLHLVMRELKTDHCLFVGDSEIDVATAKAAGMPLALFTRGYRQTSVADLAPEFHFDNHADLFAIVEGYFSLLNRE